MSRRSWTLLVGLAVALVLGLVGGSATVPYVALGPGPTYDTLGVVARLNVVHVIGERTYPTAGNLNLTTVAVTDDVTLFGALGLWVSGRYALVPRSEIFPPDQTEEQIQQSNNRAFRDSESDAEAAALSFLGYPKVAIVDVVFNGTPAQGKLEPGDELLAVNGRPVAGAAQVMAALAGSRPGQQVQLTYRRGGAPPATTTVTLGRADGHPQGFLGIRPAERADVDFAVIISLADVGGPSAGLMFALAIVDKLRPGPLTNGQFVAGTGVISPNGEVGPIGGIPFKMTAAREQGATVFLVPAANCAEAAAQAPDGLRLVRAGTLREAVTGLETLRQGGEPPGC